MVNKFHEDSALIYSCCVFSNLCSKECAIDLMATNGTVEVPANPIDHHQNQQGRRCESYRGMPCGQYVVAANVRAERQRGSSFLRPNKLKTEPFTTCLIRKLDGINRRVPSAEIKPVTLGGGHTGPTGVLGKCVGPPPFIPPGSSAGVAVSRSPKRPDTCYFF